jgi:hypothetical protein
MQDLTRDAILSTTNDLPREAVDCPEWNGRIWIRTLSGDERDRFEASTVQTNSKDRRANLRNIRARLVVEAACDKDGKRLFTAEDVAALGRRSSKVLDRLFTKARQLSGMTEEDIDELAGESDAGPSGSSGAGSP